MQDIESSIIIPVLNNWDLTRKCLESLQANTNPENVEIIVVDNASSDITPQVCPAFGKQLFGGNFKYIRNGENRNFAGASNQGANAASGRYLIFLNNDTEILAGWYDPLINDFANYPDIAATGPLLAYPEEGPLGRAIQHVGVILTPWINVEHLYQGLPVDSPLAKKRRFFQVITAACMVMPRHIFMEVGQFDENFINGFEDVDLCARLWHKGYKFTVNPESRLLHYESRTQGRSKYEEENSIRLQNGSLNYLDPDLHCQIQKDGLEFQMDKWGVPQIKYPKDILGKLNPSLRSLTVEGLKTTLIRYPFWQEGWQTLLGQTRDLNEKLRVFKEMLIIFKTPENAIMGCNLAIGANDAELLRKCFTMIKDFMESPENIRENIIQNQKLLHLAGMDELSEKYGEWLKHYDEFKNVTYPQLANSYMKLLKRIG